MASFSAKKGQIALRFSAAELDGAISRLVYDHLFDLERLLAWLESISTAAFWNVAGDDVPAYPPPAQRYLDEVFLPASARSYPDTMRTFARAIFEEHSRRDPADLMTFGVRFTPAIEAALMVLTAQMSDLKALQYFCSDDVSADIDVATMTPIVLARDADPSLQDFCYEWLSFHFRVYAAEYREALQASEAERQDEKGDNGGEEGYNYA